LILCKLNQFFMDSSDQVHPGELGLHYSLKKLILNLDQ
jgi:hypothetical protein